MNKLVVSAMIALVLSVALSGCGYTVRPHASEQGSDRTVASAPQVELFVPGEVPKVIPKLNPGPVEEPNEVVPAASEPKRVLDAFMVQVAADLLVFEDRNVSGSAAGYGDAVFMSSFTKSLSYFAPTLPVEVSGMAVGTFFSMYQQDRDMKIESRTSRFVFLRDDRVSTCLTDLRYSSGVVSTPARDAPIYPNGCLTMALVDGEWVIDGFTYVGHQP